MLSLLLLLLFPEEDDCADKVFFRAAVVSPLLLLAFVENKNWLAKPLKAEAVVDDDEEEEVEEAMHALLSSSTILLLPPYPNRTCKEKVVIEGGMIAGPVPNSVGPWPFSHSVFCLVTFCCVVGRGADY